VARGKGVRHVVELNPYPVAAPGLERLRFRVALAVGQVEDAVGDERRLAVPTDVAKTRHDEGVRPVGADLQVGDRRAQDLEALGERRGLEADRRPVVELLVCWQIVGEPVRAPFAGAEAQPLRRVDLERGLALSVLAQPAGAQEEAPLADIG